MVRNIAAAAILATLGMGSALAAGPTTILYGDLNLATTSGSAALAARVQTAATAYCSAPAPTYMVAPAFAAGATTACVKQMSRKALLELSSTATPQQFASR